MTDSTKSWIKEFSDESKKVSSIKTGDHSIETIQFDCIDCNYHIYSIGYHDGTPICGLCRWLRNQKNLSKEEKARLIKIVRGEEDEKNIGSVPRTNS